MKSGNLRRGLLTGLVYIGIFIGLVFLQFSSPSGLVWKSGLLSANTSGSRSQSDKPDRFQFSFAGLRLFVDQEHPASVLLSDGTSKAVALLSANRDPGGLTILFSREVKLIIKVPEMGGDQPTLFNVVATDSQVSGLRFTYDLVSGANLSASANSSVISGPAGGLSFSLPITAFANGRFTIPASAQLVVRAKAAATKAKSTLSVKSDVEFRQGVLAWIDKTWVGLNESRFDSASLNWKGADSIRAFNETSLVAWLAESFRRGTGEPALAKARSQRDKYAGQLSFLSVPYFGNTIAEMTKREAADSVEAKRLALLVQVNDPTVLEAPDLVRRLVDRTPAGFYQDVIRYLSSLDPATLTLPQLVGLANASVDAGLYLRGSVDPLPNHVAAESRLISAMVKVDDSFYVLVTGDGLVDVPLSLDAGLALVALGKSEAKDELLASGQALVEGALSLATAEGFLPAQISLKAGSVATKTGSVAPEVIYPKLANNPFYPHEVSFARDVEPGVWAWTCASALSVEGSASRRVFSATFPIGLSHYMAIYGVKNFANIKLYGIDYSPDAQFESYNVSGYLYKGSSSALYLKMRQKAEIERIELAF